MVRVGHSGVVGLAAGLMLAAHAAMPPPAAHAIPPAAHAAPPAAHAVPPAAAVLSASTSPTAWRGRPVAFSSGGRDWLLPVRDAGSTVGAGDWSSDPGATTSAGIGTGAPPTRGTPARPAAVQREGSVVAVFDDPLDPLVVLAVEKGYLTVRLLCGSHCPTIRLGDYVVAEGRRRSEAVLDAVEVWVVTP